MKKIVKKDRVVVISGRHKGSIGVVLQVFPKENRVLIEGVNKVRRHKKNADANNPQDQEAPIHISNVALADAKTDKPIKVGFRMEGDKKVRFNKKTGETIKKP